MKGAISIVLTVSLFRYILKFIYIKYTLLLKIREGGGLARGHWQAV
jgi:hypothetical protein